MVVLTNYENGLACKLFGAYKRHAKIQVNESNENMRRSVINMDILSMWILTQKLGGINE